MSIEHKSGCASRLSARLLRDGAVPKIAALVSCASLLIPVYGCDIELAEPEIHLIAAGYAGDVFIIHNAHDGERPEKSGLARVYRIPRDGVLRSRSATNHGVRPKPSYFYVDAAGRKTRIEGYWTSSIHDTPENRADPTVGVFFPRTGTYSSGEIPCEVVYQQYFVGTKGQLLSREGNADEARFQRHVTDRPPCGPGAG